MQQPYQFRNQQVRRVLLGPFTSRADAFTGLQRLRQLGEHGDAKVVDTTGEPSAQ
jgi:cell division protein FtsN